MTEYNLFLSISIFFAYIIFSHHAKNFFLYLHYFCSPTSASSKNILHHWAFLDQEAIRVLFGRRLDHFYYSSAITVGTFYTLENAIALINDFPIDVLDENYGSFLHAMGGINKGNLIETTFQIDVHMSIPSINIGPYLDGSDKKGVAKQIGDACTSIGFSSLAVMAFRSP